MRSTSKKAYIFLSVIITLAFVALGATVFKSSYLRLWESVKDLGISAKYYFCELSGIEHSGQATVTEFSKVFDSGGLLPETSDGFKDKTTAYFKRLISKENVEAWAALTGQKTAEFSRWLVLLMPLFIGLRVFIRQVYGRYNTKHNSDTVPLKIFKKTAAVIYQPIKRFIVGYTAYLKDSDKWRKVWITLSVCSLNLASIAAEFIAYYLYFAVSYRFDTVYGQIRKLLIDLQVIFKHFPWWTLLWIGFALFRRWRENIARGILRHNEARNCGFIKELPIVTMICGSMGMKKTTAGTDMALSQTVMFRQEAFARLQRADMKFPYFPWICLEKDIKAGMENGRIYNLASIKTWVAEKRTAYESEKDLLYGYDGERYGMYYDDCLKRQYIFEVLETYAKLYFIYVIESSLLVSNYAIREDEVIYDAGNFPLRSYDFFPEKCPEHPRFAHILDFDVLRLGKKVIENNPRSGSFEFGVVVITEVGKERGNNLELKEVKKTSEDTNQKNDLFNAWLKMCRHSATVDNFPFIKVITDEQRPESWGADARDLCDILTITGSGKQRLALPFYTIEEMLNDWAFSMFTGLYYDFRFRRGDNTLLVHVLKSIVGKIWAHNERIYNRFGYSVLTVEKERGTMDGKAEKKRYYLANGKIYRDRFSTDCFSDYFNELAAKSKTGLTDYPEYAFSKASVKELKMQNSYFIDGLYGDNDVKK